MNQQEDRLYVYGMRLRPAGIGAQPKGFIEILEPTAAQKRYWDIVVYERRLTDQECFVYSMDLIKVCYDSNSQEEKYGGI